MDNVGKNREMKLLTTEARRNYLAAEPNFHKKIVLRKIYQQ